MHNLPILNAIEFGIFCNFHYGCGNLLEPDHMDTITIAAIVIGLLLGICHFFLEIRIEKLIDRAFAALGLQSGMGPLPVTSEAKGTRLVLTLTNQGRHAVRIAGIQGRNRDDKPVFPIPSLDEQISHEPTEEEARRAITRLTIEPGASRQVFLQPDELSELGCRKIAVIDSNAKFWPVAGFSGIRAIRESRGLIPLATKPVQFGKSAPTVVATYDGIGSS